MGTPVTANLAYGYDVGNMEESQIFEATWWDDESGVEAPVQLYDALYAAIPGAPAEGNADRRQSAAEKHYGVEVAYCGTDELEGWVLIAVGSEREACNADTMVLDLRDLEHPPGEWFGRLTDAVETLGITPKQAWPQWLVYPSLG